MSVQHLIFDFDGTLVDSGPAILDTFARALRACDLLAARPLTRDLIGPPLHSTLRTLTGIDDPAQIERLAAEFRARYDTEGVYVTESYPGVGELLEHHVRAGRTLHLATNKRQRPTLLLLEHFRWKDWFTSIYCSDSRQPPFPSKSAMLQAQLCDLGLDPAQCLYIGDTGHDERAAADAGIAFVGAAWGYGSGPQAVSPAARLLRSPQELELL